MKNTILALFLVLSPVTVWANDLVDQLQQVSFAVTTHRGSGSGVLRTRKIGNDHVNFIITAAHVVEGNRHVKSIVDGKTGQSKKVVYFDDVEVVQVLNEDGRVVARHSLMASVVKYNRDEDLALLRVRKKNFSTASAKIYLDKSLPTLGSDVWNVGSALGLDGFNTVSKGIISHHGRLLNSRVYDQVSCPGFPGCSGSGLFLNDGRMIGTLTNGSGETFILCVPARRIVQWTKDSGIEWSVNDAIDMPSEKDLAKIPVEDQGKDAVTDYRSIFPDDIFGRMFKVNKK